MDSNNQPRIEDRGSGSGLVGAGGGAGRRARLQRQCDNAQLSVVSVERCDFLASGYLKGHATLLVPTGPRIPGRSLVLGHTQHAVRNNNATAHTRSYPPDVPCGCVGTGRCGCECASPCDPVS